MALAAAAALCLASARSGLAVAQEQPVIHVALSAFEAQADAYYAQELGLFKRAGLNIEIEQLQGGEAIVAGLAGGAIQIGAGTPVPLANAHLRGIDVVLVAPGTIYDSSVQPVSGLMVATASPLKTAKDFNGKTIAVNTLHSVDQIAMDAWTDQNGGDSKTLKFLEVPNITMVDAAAGGRVDGAIIADPGYTAGLESGKVRHLANVNTGVAKRFMVSAWFSSRAWADRNPDAIRKFAAAINDGATWAIKNPQPAALVLQKYMRLTVSSAHEHHGFTLDPALLQPLVDASARYGVLKSQFDVHDIIWRYPTGDRHMNEIDDIRERVAQACRVLGALNITKGPIGHVSARVPGTERIFIRARGPEELGVRYTTPAEIIEVDLDGKAIDAKPGFLAPSEVFIHTSLYRARPEVNGVVHVHPAKVVLFTICKKPLLPLYGAYDPSSLRLALDGIPTYPRAITITTPALGADLVQVMGSKPACLMRGHGITTANRSVEDAALDAIDLNELAVMNYEAHLLGDAEPISEEDQEVYRTRTDAGRYKPGSDGRPGERARAVWRYYTTLTESG